jgi:hypothetical protein
MLDHLVEAHWEGILEIPFRAYIAYKEYLGGYSGILEVRRLNIESEQPFINIKYQMRSSFL